MNNIPQALIQMGFQPRVDFICQDDANGKGVYIAQWLSDRPQPPGRDIEAMVLALDEGAVVPTKALSLEERLLAIEAKAFAQGVAIEEVANKAGTLEAKWSAE